MAQPMEGWAMMNEQEAEYRKARDCVCPVAATVAGKIEARAAIGLAKYHTTLARTDLTRREWLDHAQQEAMDLACYLQKLIDAEEATTARNFRVVGPEAITDIAADVAFTLSPMGRERREDREIAYAEEIMRLRHEMRRVIAEREEARKAMANYDVPYEPEAGFSPVEAPKAWRGHYPSPALPEGAGGAQNASLEGL